NLRIKSAIDGTATPEAFVKSANKSQDSRRKRGRQTDCREFLERNFGVFLQGERVDIFFRDKKQHFVSALAQHFGDSKSRKKVPASSSACDNGVHKTADCGLPPSVILSASEGSRIDGCVNAKTSRRLTRSW